MYRHLESHAIIIPSKLKKIVILIGWLANPSSQGDTDEFISSEDTLRLKACDETTDKVDTDLCKAILNVEGDYFLQEIDPITSKPKFYLRASKSSQRSTFILGAEASVNGSCDTAMFQARIWPGGDTDWVDRVNKELSTINPNIKILHRYLMPPGTHNFHPEKDCTQRRYEYILPLHVLTNDDIYKRYIPETPVKERRLKWLEEKSNEDIIRIKNSSVGVRFPANTEMGQVLIVYFRKMKKILKRFNGWASMHNFTTGGGCPEEGTSNRRIDRIYHKDIQTICGKDFLVLSISGDLFMRGQVRHIIGLLLAILSFWLPEEYLDSALDKDNIADIPPVPGFALTLCETRFSYFEGNEHFIVLDPRREKDGDKTRINDWSKQVNEHIASKWDQVDLTKWMQEFKSKCNSLLHLQQLILPLLK
jgi:tRNA pseudouridine(38-40) synthase